MSPAPSDAAYTRPGPAGEGIGWLRRLGPFIRRYRTLVIATLVLSVVAQTLIRDALKKYPRVVGLKVFASPGPPAEPRLIAGTDPSEIGRLAAKTELEVIARNAVGYGRDDGTVTVTLPLHDANGDAIAAVQAVMKTFPGQTEKNAITRAVPIVKLMEGRIKTARDLVQ